jgi:hypothetical protein
MKTSRRKIKRLHKLLVEKMPFVTHKGIFTYDERYSVVYYDDISVSHTERDTFIVYGEIDTDNIVHNNEYITIEEAVDKVIEHMFNTKRYYEQYMKYEMERKIGEINSMKITISWATYIQKETIKLLEDNFNHDNVEKCEKDDLLTLQNYCKSLIDSILNHKSEN